MVFIFDPFDRQNSEVEIPELVQETAQGGLVRERTGQQCTATIQGGDGQPVEPIHDTGDQGFLDLDPISISLNSSFWLHPHASENGLV